jgi:hypothetical protein
LLPSVQYKFIVESSPSSPKSVWKLDDVCIWHNGKRSGEIVDICLWNIYWRILSSWECHWTISIYHAPSLWECVGIGMGLIDDRSVVRSWTNSDCVIKSNFEWHDIHWRNSFFKLPKNEREGHRGIWYANSPNMSCLFMISYIFNQNNWVLGIGWGFGWPWRHLRRSFEYCCRICFAMYDQ